MARRNFPHEGIIWLAPSEIHRDPEVNRFYEEHRAQKMVKDGFDPKRARSAGYCVSTREDGSHIWLDGQHRGEAAIMRDLGDVAVPCYQLKGLTKPQEAEWVLLFQEDRKRATPADAHRLGMQAGRPIDLALARVCHKHDLIPDGGTSDGHLSAIAHARKIVAQEGGEGVLDASLTALLAAYGPVAGAVEGSLIQGMARVYAKHNGTVDQAALIKKLAKRGGPASLVGAARTARDIYGRTIAVNVANIIIASYNKGRRSGKLEEV